MPEVASAIDTLGWVQYKRSSPALAVDSFRRATELEPGNALFHFHLGLAFVKLGDKPSARSALTKALALQADFSGADEARRTLASL
jgi:Flp pilus assembly protein TadD